MTSSSSLGFVRFQIFLMTALSSLLATSRFPFNGGDTQQCHPSCPFKGGGCAVPPLPPPSPKPSVLILRDVRTRANSVALKVTVPSELRGMFMATRRWGRGGGTW